MIPATGALSLPNPGPPGPPESAFANLAPILWFAPRHPAPVSRKAGATDRGRGPAA